MTEIIEKAGEVVKGKSFLDNILSPETFETLDKNAHTLDQIGNLMEKANALLGNPVIGQVVELAAKMKTSTGVAMPVSEWDAPTMSEMAGGHTPMAAPRQAQLVAPPQQPTIAAPMPNNAAPLPPQAEVSELHTQVKGEIDKLSEKDLMDLLMKMSSDPDIVDKVSEMQGGDTGEESKPKITDDSDK